MAKRSRSRPGGAAGWAALPACLFLLVGGLHAEKLSGLDVGRISDLDLKALRTIIDDRAEIDEPGTTGFRSLSLEEAVKTALEENLGLQIVAVDVASSERQIDVSKSKFHPVAAVEGEATGTRRNESSPLLEDQASDLQEAQVVLRQEVPTGGNVSFGVGYAREFRNEVVTDQANGDFNQTNLNEIAGLGIEVSQPLLRGGRTYVARQRILDARYDTEVRRAELKGEILRVTAETKAAYYQVIGAGRQIEVVEQALIRDSELIRASSALFDAGRVSKVDLFSAEISQSNDRARLATAQANLEVAQNALRKVIGLPVNVDVEVTDTTIPFWPIQMDLKGWVERAIDMRPELLALQSERAKIELAVKVRKNEKLPGLDVKGGFFPGFDWKSYNYNAGVSFDYPLGNAAAQGRLDQARLAEVKIRHEIARARRDIELEVREIEIRLRESLARVENLTAAVTSAREKREIARGRFEMGLANNLDITNADQELIRAETLLLEALVDYATNIALLESRVGGAL
ncbi:MAG: TolC family protein [Myxococcota bacterium]|nr:TolC family protein [Myxococcota bacterium]